MKLSIELTPEAEAVLRKDAHDRDVSVAEYVNSGAVDLLLFREPQASETIKAVSLLDDRLQDAETTIAKIGFCDPAPQEARGGYERKYGSVGHLESRVVR